MQYTSAPLRERLTADDDTKLHRGPGKLSAEAAMRKTFHFVHQAFSPEQLSGPTDSIYISSRLVVITIIFIIDPPVVFLWLVLRCVQ